MTKVKDTSVKDIKKVEIKQDIPEKLTDEKRFNINVESDKDADGNVQIFTFSGPEKASIGLIYDAIYRIMMEVISILQKRAEELKPKTVKDTGVKEEVKDIKKKDK